MRAGLSRQKSDRECATRQLRQSGPGSVVGSACCRSQRETACVARSGNEGCQLCNALCLRTTARISNRCLDREGFEATVFSAEEKNHGTAVARIFGNIFWRTRRLRAAILVSSRANRFSKIHNGEELRRWRRRALAPKNTPFTARGRAVPIPCPARRKQAPSGSTSCVRKANGPVSQVVSTPGLRYCSSLKLRK